MNDATGATNAVIHFPPTYVSDFVIHYRGTAFHVHKFVLIYHSSYFRTYIEALTRGQRAYPNTECDDHSDIEHCVRLPDSCGKVEADVDNFRLFLCHLYFAQQYCCVPFTANSDIDLAAQPVPAVSFDYPHFRHDGDLNDATACHLYGSDPLEVCESVMSLCHYLDCARILSRAEDNCLLLVVPDEDYSNAQLHQLWPLFKLALQFDLQRVKKACMPPVARHGMQCYQHKEEWESIRPLLSKDTLFEMLQVTFEEAGV